MNFLDDLLRGGESDRIAENPWSSGQGPSEEIPPCLADYHIKKYFYHEDDMVIVCVDHFSISAGVYNNRESFEFAKREKSREMDKLIDEISK